MADANHKAQPSRAERSRRIAVKLRGTPDGYSLDTPPHPQQPFMPWEHVDNWLGAGYCFSTGQRVYVPVDYSRQCLTVTPEYDDTARARERAQRAIERRAANEELRNIWRAQADNRAHLIITTG